MTCVYTSKLYFGLLFLILSFQQCCSTDDQSVQCKIINLQYVECFWHPNTSAMNYTFSSAFLGVPSQDCPEYIMEHSYTVGCRITLINPTLKFKQFSTNISSERNHTFSKTFHSLERKVQLNPPYNLSVVWNEQDSTLLLQWNSSSPRPNCVVYMVHNKEDTREPTNVTGTSYIQSQVSRNKPYVFQVRSTVSHPCGDSDFWSNWSSPVQLGTGNSRQGWWQGFFGILPVVLLFLLGLTLCYCERKRIIFLPAVPDPSKNLQDLFHKHDGNVESWVHISRELKEAFEPDYTEPSCDVCEVTPSCPTPEDSPASQTDNCDEPSTKERHADEPDTEEERPDKLSTEEERPDKLSTEEECADEPDEAGQQSS